MTKTRRTGMVLSWLGVLGVLVATGLAGADEEPKLAGVEVPAPKRTRFVAPEYPADAKALGQRGIVILSLVIGVDGKVAAAEVVRSVAAFDEAALAAARLWEYEITRIEGKPVSVRLSVPISFALRLPEVVRGAGVRELREGLTPNRPAGVPDKAEATVVTALTVQPSGEVVTIDVEKGAWPWFEATTAALRTWAFVADGSEAVATYEVEARFLPVRKGQSRVELRLDRRATSASAEATEPPPIEPSPQAEPSPEAVPAPVPPPGQVQEPAPTTERVPPPDSPQPPSPASKEPSAPPVPSPAPSVSDRPLAPVVPAAAPSGGVSAVRDVSLGPGVPDLASGRRPVVPPLARMAEVSGTVEVRFSVDAGGVTSGLEVSGPEPLREAARQAVVSWSFRRTSAERLFLIARFEYRGRQASAIVERAAP